MHRSFLGIQQTHLIPGMRWMDFEYISNETEHACWEIEYNFKTNVNTNTKILNKEHQHFSPIKTTMNWKKIVSMC